MKKRLKNYISTIFGALLMLVALTMFILDRIPSAGIDFSLFEMTAVAVLGWVFLFAKDSLIEGIFLGIFKVKAKD